MTDKSYLVDASDQGDYGTSYTPSPHDGSIDQGAPPSNNLDNSTQGQGMFSNGPATMPSTGVYVVSSVPVSTMITRQAPPRPQTYVVHNVLVLICCCLVFGILGVIKGSQVDSLYIQGHYEAAEVASQSAKKWFKWGVICGVVVYVCVIALWMIIIFV